MRHDDRAWRHELRQEVRDVYGEADLENALWLNDHETPTGALAMERATMEGRR
jgi:hypothetical protein